MADLTEKQLAALAAGRKPFTSTNQPANRGRKPSKLKKWCKEHNVGVADYKAIFNNIIACKTVRELQDMIKKGNVEDLPVVVVSCASAVVDDIQHGRMTWINTVLDRVMGKPAQTVETNGHLDITQAVIDYSMLSDEQLSEIIRSTESQDGNGEA